jgi:hypothetical protein
VRSYRGTASYEKALRKRKVWIEPIFAEAKEWHGLRRFRLRTLRRVNVEALLVAAGQNLKRLLFFGGRKPRKPAQVAALRPPAAYIGSHSSGRHRLGLGGKPKSILQQAGWFAGHARRVSITCPETSYRCPGTVSRLDRPTT